MEVSEPKQPEAKAVFTEATNLSEALNELPAHMGLDDDDEELKTLSAALHQMKVRNVRMFLRLMNENPTGAAKALVPRATEEEQRVYDHVLAVCHEMIVVRDRSHSDPLLV